MIRVFFNEDGYYVAGEKVELARRVSPATSAQGDRIFQPIHHTYKILYLALCELEKIQIEDDVVVYNDSRIIDEVNGYIAPLDDTCQQWINVLKRNVIPTIRSVVIFRKKPQENIRQSIQAGHSKMIVQVDRRTLEGIAKLERKTLEKKQNSRKQRLIDYFKKRWFNDGNRQEE